MRKKLEKKEAIFTGRFQLVHYGHLATLKELLKRHKKVTIVIGTRKFQNFDHPFSGYERKQMWEAAIRDAGLPRNRIRILPLKKTRLATDLAVYMKFIAYRIGSKNAVYYTGNNRVKRALEDAGAEVRGIPAPVTHSANEVRLRIVSGKDWKCLVPPSVAKIILDKKLDARLQKLFKKRERNA